MDDSTRGDPRPDASVAADAGVGDAATALPEGGDFALVGVRLAGEAEARTVEIASGRIVGIGSGHLSSRPGIDLRGRVLAPAFIDAHVHLAYLPVGPELVRRGVAAVVDLASPLGFLATTRAGALDHAPLRVIGAGPMITAIGGYPTRGWGRDGYGLECADEAAAIAAVERVHAAGARLVKVPVGSAPELDDTVLAAMARRAHELGLRVAVHALSNAAARRAAIAGADLLAHTPVEPLADDTLALWASRAVVSTLVGFGESDAAIDNLARLRAAGATVMYGTDLGNTSDAGIDARELRALVRAGLDGRAILEAGTKTPAAYFGFDELGGLEVGRAASFLVLDRDPVDDPSVLATPRAVYVDGRLVSAM